MPETGPEKTGKNKDGGFVRLHSRFNPRLEAERYLDALSIRDEIKYFILIEPGRGYLASLLAGRRPGAKIISLHVEEPEEEEPAAPERTASWSPLRGPLSAFLEREIPDTPSSRIMIVEWRPARTVYGRDYLSLVAETAEFIRRADAGARTLRAFGGRWMRNFFRNLSVPFTFLIATSPRAPVLVACSGPGLEGALSRIQKMKEDGCFILAASSSVMALRAGGIIPDMVISTDGGNWALLHLYECLRPGGENQAALAAGLFAALPSQCSGFPLLAIDDGSLWQRIVLSGLGIPSVSLAQRGTVAASALDLAFHLCADADADGGAGGVFIAGADLLVRGIRTHSRPYGFDRLVSEDSSRLGPAYSRSFERALAAREGGSHGIYAAWFKNQLENYPGPVVPVGDNNPLFGAGGPGAEGKEGAAARGAGENAKGRPLGGTVFETRRAGAVPPALRARKAADILARALEEKDARDILCRELYPLLFPEKDPAGADLPELKDAVYALARRAAGNNHGR